MKQINLTISDEQFEILKKIKINSGIPINFQINKAIDIYIKKQEKEEKKYD